MFAAKRRSVIAFGLCTGTGVFIQNSLIGERRVDFCALRFFKNQITQIFAEEIILVNQIVQIKIIEL